MGLMLLKKLSLLFLLVSASLLSTSLAGRAAMSIHKVAKEVDATQEDAGTVHERLLRVNTKDYGRYDPPPNLVRPPFKLIPN